MSIITIERKILEKNDLIAEENRKKFKEKNIFTLNLVSSPGSGKTSLIEKSLEIINKEIKISVIEGDVQTGLDAERVGKYGVPVVQIVTNGACHLEAALVRDAFRAIEALDTQLLIIENVGNLVCPAGYDLGENMKVVILSVAEGDDKPLKYPAMFRKASVLVINKIDLLPYVNCSPEALAENALSINPELKIFKTSCTSTEGIKEWCRWIASNIN
ncbi:MAG TPA: hydrogenase nickel incorporation protein HypB [Ignavibacteriaceae bacterium]|nr:hydrogenase nickel incorporation protein HypB [Ignavibacteriaceae bacterium]